MAAAVVFVGGLGGDGGVTACCCVLCWRSQKNPCDVSTFAHIELLCCIYRVSVLGAQQIEPTLSATCTARIGCSSANFLQYCRGGQYLCQNARYSRVDGSGSRISWQ